MSEKKEQILNILEDFLKIQNKDVKKMLQEIEALTKIHDSVYSPRTQLYLNSPITRDEVETMFEGDYKLYKALSDIQDAIRREINLKEDAIREKLTYELSELLISYGSNENGLNYRLEKYYGIEKEE